MHELVNNCWHVFKWAAALIVVALIAAGLQRFLHVDDEIRSRVEAKLAAGYPQLKVTVRSARLVKGEGIEVRGVSITDPHATGPTAELMSVEELSLSCGTDLSELARKEPHFSKIVIRRAIIRATRRANGTWTSASLLPVPKFGPSTPPIEIEGVTVEVLDPTRQPASLFTVRDVRLSLDPKEQSDPQQTAALAVRGTFSADYVEQVAFNGMLDSATNQFLFDGLAEGIRLSPELLAKLPSDIPARPAPLDALRANVRVRFRVQRDPQLTPALRFQVESSIAGGRLSDPRLPYPITDIRGAAKANNAGFVVEEFSAQSGPTVLRGKAQGAGFGDGGRMEIDLEAASVRLDRRLADSLPDSLRQVWYKFLPEGDVDATAKLVLQNGKWKPDATVNCRNVSFSYFKFPYRLEQTKGTLRLVGNTVSLRMMAAAGSQPIRLTGEFLNPGPQFSGWFEAQGDGVPLDDKLVTALPDKPREVVRSLHPQGSMNLILARIWRDAGETRVHKQVTLAFNRCSISYDKFPYPIANIRGTAQMTDDEWTFRDLVGTNDTGLVTCEGFLRPAAQGSELALHFTGERVPLEEELRTALPSNMQRLWRSLEPRGEVNLSTDVTYLSAQRRTSVAVVAEPRGGSTSIEPQAFPYRMENLRGAIHYRDGHAELQKVEAEHGRTKLTADGQCDFLPDGSWSLQLKNFAVDRLRADHDLLTALPGSLKRAVTQLKPSGPVNLRGTVMFSRPGEPEAALQTQWDVVADMLQIDLDCGVRLDNLFGSVRLAGQSEGENFKSRGELSLDSLTYKNFQFTEVMGPFSVDNGRVLFGAWTESPQPGRPPRRVTGKLCKGVVSGDAQVIFAAAPQYALQAQLADADLQQVIGEHLSSKLQASGQLLANLQLQGTGRGTHTMGGRGSIRLKNADIYELPVMVSLLKILSIKQPDATAFTKSDIDFRVQGEHILFDRINFNGDAVSLLGKGQMNLDKQLDLTFHAMVGRDDSNFQVPILRNVIGEASQQIMQIHVEGSCDDPITRREAFPGVNQALQALQAEMQRSEQPVEREAALPK